MMRDWKMANESIRFQNQCKALGKTDRQMGESLRAFPI
jgi:hypothetical protein